MGHIDFTDVDQPFNPVGNLHKCAKVQHVGDGSFNQFTNRMFLCKSIPGCGHENLAVQAHTLFLCVNFINHYFDFIANAQNV